MRILVTGGAGFIGSNLVKLLIARGHKVLNIDKLTYAVNLASLNSIAHDPSYHFLQADICDYIALLTAFLQFKPDTVMHLAAESHVDRSIDGPMEFVRSNVVGTVTLLQTATEYRRGMGKSAGDFRFLHVSTDEVYGTLGENDYFTENTPYDPHSPYSASKASSDHFARAWRDTYGLR